MRFLILALAFIGLAVACKKTTSPGMITTPPPGSQSDLLKDSVYLYSKEVYLWDELVTDYTKFNPRGYSGATDLQVAENVMNGIRALQPLDRFSFVTTKEESAGLQTGAKKEFGFFIKSASMDLAMPMDSIFWFVSYVYNTSPAGMGGVQRGWRITKVNGTVIDYSSSSINLLNEVFFGATNNALFQFMKQDGADASVNLAKSTFVANSVLHRSVLTSGSTKMGYMVFNQFFGETSRKELGDVFSYFEGQGITDLIVDLRYNPGGSTQTQDTLANLIAPQSANGKTMYKYVYNKTLQQNQHQLIRKKLGYGNLFEEANNTQLFKKAGSLQLTRVFFIVSGSSASASELLINNLKPHMTVKIVGDTTYGKPVGFFPIPVYDLAVYPISFKTVNSSGNADFYTGFIPDALVADGVNKSWGDPNEPSLGAAMKYILTGSFRLASTDGFSMQVNSQQQMQSVQNSMEEKKFIGMFRER